MTEWTEALLLQLRAQIFPFGLFIILLGVFYFLGRKVICRLQTWALKTQVLWDDELVRILRFPMNVAILIGALNVSAPYFSGWFAVGSGLVLFTKISLSIVATWLCGKVLVLLFRSRRLFSVLDDTGRIFLTHFVWVIIWVLGGLVILDTVGVSITPFIASLGIGSLAIGLALQDTLSNFFSSIYILLDRPFRIQDQVRLDPQTEGRVIRIGWRSTHLRLGSNSVVVVPNSKMAQTPLVNYDLLGLENQFSLSVWVAADNDLELVEKLAREVAMKVASETQGAITSFTPLLRWQNWTDLGLELVVTMQSQGWKDQDLIKHEFYRALQKRFRAEEIKVPKKN